VPSHFTRKTNVLSFTVLFVAILSVLAILSGPALAQNPVPSTNQPLVPDAATPGGSGFTLTVNGTGFVAASIVNWNGSRRVTTFVSSSQLTAAILTADIAEPSTATVTVVNPGPGGGSSIPIFFSVAEPEGSVPFVKTDSASPGANVEIATADFNGDGIPDLVAGEYYNSVAAILLGNGDGTFREGATYSACQAHGVAVGDLNGDGFMDVAVSDGGCGEVTILLGKGDGTFAKKGPFSTGGSATVSPYSVAVGDFNGDGKLDLVTADETLNQVSILIGNGDGTFQVHVDYATGTDSWKVVTGDFNRDGHLDVAVAGAAGVVVLLGNGDGTLQPAVLYPFSPGGFSPYMLTADLNGDDKLDFVIADTAGTIGVMLGNGDGTFNAPVTYATGGFPSCCTAVAAADFRGVGVLDLAITNSGGATISLLPGNGDGTFGNSVSYPADNGARGVAVADFDGKGRLGLAVGNQFVDSVSIFLQTPGLPPTSTTLASSLNPSNFGQSVTFTATVSSSSGTPTGTVIFYDGSTSLGSAMLASGKASLSTSSLGAGSHSVTAAYQGSSSFAASTSAALNQVVNGATTTTSLASSLNPSVYWQNVTFTAVVSSGSGTPTGTVIFYDGSTSLGSATLVSGNASLSSSSLVAASHSITAAYQGSGAFGTSTSVPLNQIVGSATTTSALSSSVNPARIKQDVTYTATVTSEFGGTATGTVTFQDDGTFVNRALSGNQATYTTSYSAGGLHSIIATYSGDANNAGSTSNPLSEEIDGKLVASTTTVTTSESPSFIGQTITFTATVTSKGGPIPDGEQVTFEDGSVAIGVGTTASGVATFSTASLGASKHTIKAIYSGDGNFKASTGKVTQIVDKYTTTTVLVSSLNPAMYGQGMTFTATVTSSGPVPTREVKFTGIGEATLSGGVATITKTQMRAGTHAITAEYLGDDVSLPSKSSVLDEVVNPASTTATITSSANPSSSGQTVTFAATVTSSTGLAPFGNVTFTAGTTTLGTVTLKDATASIATATLPVGTTTVTATYNGAAGFTGSSASLTQTVEP
jgi:hypothetical protein